MAVVGASGAGAAGPHAGYMARFEVYLTRLGAADAADAARAPDAGAGGDRAELRPCVIVSPDEMNGTIGTVIVAPVRARGASYPTRVECELGGREAEVVLDQLRTVAVWRLVESLGRLDEAAEKRVLAGLQELFAP